MSNTERLDAIRAALDEVESPSPTPLGAPGSMMRRAWELGRERQATARELERWRHGQTIEGDYVCPDTLALAAAEKERDEARAGWKHAALELDGYESGAPAKGTRLWRSEHELAKARAQRDAVTKERDEEREWRKVCQRACGDEQADRNMVERFFFERSREWEATKKERDAAIARAEKAEAESAAMRNATRVECANPDLDADTDREIMCDCCTAMHDRRKAAVDTLRKGGA